MQCVLLPDTLSILGFVFDITAGEKATRTQTPVRTMVWASEMMMAIILNSIIVYMAPRKTETTLQCVSQIFKVYRLYLVSCGIVQKLRISNKYGSVTALKQ
jgi:hypothetical protein